MELVLPGEELGTLEEFLAGHGTYERDGGVFAAIAGQVIYDREERTAQVEPVTSAPVVLANGDTVLGVVTNLHGPIAIVKVMRLADRARAISSPTQGSIHISKVSHDFVTEMGRAYKIGDMLRARVIQIDPSLQLSTAGSNFGVVHALCSVCRTVLDKHGSNCYCPNCERLWEKKVARSYRSGKI